MNEIAINPIEHLTISLNKPIGKLLICRTCANAITQLAEKTAIACSSHHRFTNPAGIIYSINCYQHAPGCAIHGQSSLQDTWFSGYRWQMANCCDCHDHMGWYFENTQSKFFFGLIQTKLIESSVR